MITISRQSGLSGVPGELVYLRAELGLVGDAWNSMGAKWQDIAALWLRAETKLSNCGHSDLSITQIRKSTIPEDWKDWMASKLMRTDAQHPAESFGQVFTEYLKGLPSFTMNNGGTVMTQIWCRPGRTGIVGLLLCLYWQSTYSGAGNDYEDNLKRVESIFQAILTSNW